MCLDKSVWLQSEALLEEVNETSRREVLGVVHVRAGANQGREVKMQYRQVRALGAGQQVKRTALGDGFLMGMRLGEREKVTRLVLA